MIAEFEPLTAWRGFEFDWKVKGQGLSKEWSKAIQAGIKEAMENGVIAGYPVVDLKVTVVDGSQHEVDSNEMAFKIAGSMALKDAVQRGSPVIVEPIMKVEVVVPQEYMGDIIGDLNSRRGHVAGMDRARQRECHHRVRAARDDVRVTRRVFVRPRRAVASYRWSSITTRSCRRTWRTRSPRSK